MSYKREFRNLRLKSRLAMRAFDRAIYENIAFLNKRYNAIRVAYHKDDEDVVTYLKKYLELDSKEISTKIKQRKILVNYKKISDSYNVVRDDFILIDKSLKLREHNVEPIEFKVLTENDKYIIVDKPTGIKVHSNFPDSENSVLECLKKTGKIQSPKYIYYESNIVHRLDKFTTGPMIVAKKQKYAVILKRLFKKRKIKKYYIALTHGEFIDKRGIVELPLIRGYDTLYGDYMVISDKPYKWAKTLYHVIGSRNNLSLVKIKIITGRTHQIRVHLSALGHPVCGDSFYSIYRDRRFPRQMLHSYLLEFVDPFDKKKIKVISPLPVDMKKILKEVYYESF